MSAAVISWPEFHMRESIAHMVDSVMESAWLYAATWGVHVWLDERDSDALDRWADDGGSAL